MKKSQVLLVDDNPEFLAMSREFLDSHEGLAVIGTAGSAGEALNLVESLRPTLIITDLVMPGSNGLELMRQVKQRWPGLPVIILTMHDTPHHRSAAIAAGADGFVTKASMDSDLLPIIRQLQVSRD